MKKIHFLNLILISAVIFPGLTNVQTVDQQTPTFSLLDEHATVYDENRNGQPDMEGDAWVFDQNSDHRPELIVLFQPEDSGVAYVYDDVDGNGQVDFKIGENSTEIKEPNWRIKVIKREADWYLPNGAPNWNFDLKVDSGFELTDIDANIGLYDSRDTAIHGFSAIDGQPELSIKYWDINRDGIPEYEYNNVNLVGWFDAFIVNKNARLSIQTSHKFFLLDTILKMDWERAHIIKIVHLIPTRLNEKGYFFYFNRAFDKEPVFALENPFAYYDLHGDQDGISELKLRMIAADFDRTHPDLITYNEVRYSWAQNGDEPDYRLYLIGQVLTNHLVKYPPYLISHIPYAELPAFALAQNWQGAAFAEYEADMSRSFGEGIYEADMSRSFGEGIYENLSFTPMLRDKLLWHLDVELPQYLPVLLQLREEYNFVNYYRQPRIYISPVDKRFHLSGAEQGLIIFSATSTTTRKKVFDFTDLELETGNLKINAQTTYADTDGDDYADTWTYWVDDESIARLIFRRGAALFVSGTSLSIKKLPSSYLPFTWETAPPATTREWREIQNRLDTERPLRRSLDDLERIFDDMPGETFSLTSVQLASVSERADKLLANIFIYDFVKDLPSVISTSVPLPIPPGKYLIAAYQGELRLEKSEPVQLDLSPITLTQSNNNSGEEKFAEIKFVVHNQGTEDAGSVHVVVKERIDKKEINLFDQTVIVPALGEKDFHVSWMPNFDGSHSILVNAEKISESSVETTNLTKEITINVEMPKNSLEIVNLHRERLILLILISLILLTLMVIGILIFAKETLSAT